MARAGAALLSGRGHAANGTSGTSVGVPRVRHNVAGVVVDHRRGAAVPDSPWNRRAARTELLEIDEDAGMALQRSAASKPRCAPKTKLTASWRNRFLRCVTRRPCDETDGESSAPGRETPVNARSPAADHDKIDVGEGHGASLMNRDSASRRAACPLPRQRSDRRVGHDLRGQGAAAGRDRPVPHALQQRLEVAREARAVEQRTRRCCSAQMLRAARARRGGRPASASTVAR